MNIFDKIKEIKNNLTGSVKQPGVVSGNLLTNIKPFAQVLESIKTPERESVKKYSDPHQRRLAAVTFAESGMYDPKNVDELKDQMRSIINVTRNRQSELKADNLTQVLTQKEADGKYSYRAIFGPEYKKFLKGSQLPFDQEKAKLIDEVMQEYLSDKLKDNTGGANAFIHENGKLKLKKISELRRLDK